MSTNAKANVDLAAAGHQFPGQIDGEIVKLVFRQHPLVMRKALIYGLLVIMFPVLPLAFPQIWSYPDVADILIKIAIFTPLVVLAVWFYRWIGWYYSVFIVTDRRLVIITQKGFFNRAVQEWQLDSIYNVNYHVDGFQAALFGYGDITAVTYMGEYVMTKIHKPVEIHRHIMEAVQGVGGPKRNTFDN